MPARLGQWSLVLSMLIERGWTKCQELSELSESAHKSGGLGGHGSRVATLVKGPLNRSRVLDEVDRVFPLEKAGWLITVSRSAQILGMLKEVRSVGHR